MVTPVLVWSRRLFWAAMVLTLAVSLWDYGGRWHTPGHYLRNLVMLGLYWGPRIAGPFLLGWLVLRVCQTTGWRRLVPTLGAGFVLMGLWASLVEPLWLRERTTMVSGAPVGASPLRLALVADLHWGLFVREGDLRRLVARLNALDVDAVLVAGDWVHEPPLDLRGGLAPLAALRHPVYGVLGNHDTGAPGPALTEPLREALRAHGVRLIDGERVTIRGWELVGLSDLWGGRPRQDIRQLWPAPAAMTAEGPPRLALFHQPDTQDLLPPGAVFLAMAGHTHGGQLWIPGFSPWWLRHTNSASGRWNGLYDTPAGRLLVTPGVGLVGVPARLGVRPTIDLLELRP
ncbi:MULTISPECIES: metallophosphoesterase [Hydrogenophaga]|uniref:Phosphohydrolase n=1 Tax=Hydrogenophaga electricum TaxID=1230953 RepID=A0ABQ6BZF1_9BURK|nr:MULTISPECIES: metallophosphoesterase [Hydrogenophaga]GLS13533.1 phosphohydrolase [Hydrogenophaga electricum]